MRSPSRQQWERLLVPALVLLILAPFVLYARFAVRTARDIARDDALERNLATAVLGARLIDEQCETALSVLSTIARHGSLVADLQARGAWRELVALGAWQRKTAARAPSGRPLSPPSAQRNEFAPSAASAASLQQLREALEVLPELDYVATYDLKGGLLVHYPPSARPERSAVTEDWFRGVAAERVPYVSEVYRLERRTGASLVGLAVPVGREGRPVGYLMAPYRLEAVHDWLEPLRIGSGGVLFVLDTDGQLVASSGALRYDRDHLKNYPPVRRALEERQGAVLASGPDGSGRALVGYAPAKVPGWAVVAIQPLKSALAPADHLVRHLWLLACPYLALMVTGGWAIEWLYRRQARLARQNAALSRDLGVQNERLRAADRARSEFLANVSHDLRTPLASIKASVSGLLEPDIDWDRETLRGFLTLVNEETDRLSGRVRNLLDMARLEAGALPMQKEVCDLTDIVASALERVEPLTRGRPIEADFPPEPLLVEADYAQMETVILNLLENAVKYSPPGAPLSLSGAATDEGNAVFILRDQGSGVPPGDEERVFEKFYRATTRTSASGTGLGLAICKAIVTAHGGAIGVRPVSGDGAEFWFSLPLYHDVPAQPVQDREKPQMNADGRHAPDSRCR